MTADYEVSDGEFKLRQKSNHVTVNMDLSGIEALISGTKDYTRRNQFILYLPEAKQISSAELDMADGDISVDRLRSDRIDISVDAGDIKLLDTESKEIKNGLKKKLPQYMIPHTIVRVAHMPLNKNGKIDRNYFGKRQEVVT